MTQAERSKRPTIHLRGATVRTFDIAADGTQKSALVPDRPGTKVFDLGGRDPRTAGSPRPAAGTAAVGADPHSVGVELDRLGRSFAGTREPETRKRLAREGGRGHPFWWMYEEAVTLFLMAIAARHGGHYAMLAEVTARGARRGLRIGGPDGTVPVKKTMRKIVELLHKPDPTWADVALQVEGFRIEKPRSAPGWPFSPRPHVREDLPQATAAAVRAEVARFVEGAGGGGTPRTARRIASACDGAIREFAYLRHPFATLGRVRFHLDPPKGKDFAKLVEAELGDPADAGRKTPGAAAEATLSLCSARWDAHRDKLDANLSRLAAKDAGAEGAS